MDSIQYRPISQPPQLKILMAHGLGQSGTIFAHKTRALEHSLRTRLASTSSYRSHHISFIYPDAPVPCRAPDLTTSPFQAVEFPHNYCWTPENDNAGDIDPMPTLLILAQLIKTHGPFDGAICFSQGGFAMAIAAALLAAPFPITEGDAGKWYRTLYHDNTMELLQPPFRFLTTFCAPDVAHTKFAPLWKTCTTTPMLQIIGRFDTLVSETSSRALASKFLNARVHTHRGAHFVPKDRASIDIATEFMMTTLLESKVKVNVYGDYFARINVPELTEDDGDDDSLYSTSSSLATPRTPDVEFVVASEGLDKVGSKLVRKAGVGVVRVKQQQSKSGRRNLFEVELSLGL